MEHHFCSYCGTPLPEKALFCTACGNKTVNVPAGTMSAAPYQAAAAPTWTAQPPQPPVGGNVYTQYPGEMNAVGAVRKKGGRGLLVGGILGLVGLALVIAVVVLIFGKPPAKKPQNTAAGSSASSSDAAIQEADDEGSSANGSVKRNAALSDITGAWQGEMRMTRMDGFDKLPAEQLPPDFKEIIAEILSAPAAMELEIEPDGSWYFNVDIETGIAFSSDDFGSGDSSPVLLTELKNGKFSVTHSEEIDEDGIKGTASIEFSGTVYENSNGLSIEGTMLLTAQQGSVSIIEEGNYTVTLITAAEAAAQSDTAAVSEQPAGADYATAGTSGSGDFLWYLDGVYYDGLPADATPVSDFADISGGWKALFYYDPDNIANAFGYDFLNIVIGGDADNTSLTLDWYLYVADIEEYDNSGMEDTLMSGSYAQGGISAGDGGFSIYITNFYYLNGKQYGVGYMELQSGEPTYVALVRP